jgi:hypothetical protein
MKPGRVFVVATFLAAMSLGFGTSLQADASGAPYIIKREFIRVNPSCTIVYTEWSNLDWTFSEVGSGCNAGPI